MSNKRGGLGRGLGALIPTGDPGGPAKVAPAKTASPPTRRSTKSDDAEARQSSSGVELAAVPGAQFREIPIAQIAPNPKQPRAVFDEEALAELKASIEQVGVLQPVVVRQIRADGYELIMGERRFRACQAAGKDSIPAIIRDTGDDVLLRDALLENIHRADLNPLEEGAAYQQLLAEFNVTHDELAQRIGRSRPQISNTIRLLNLPSAVQRRVAARVLSAGHARALLSLEHAEQQEALAHRIVAEGLSVRATEEIVALSSRELAPDKNTAQRRSQPHSPGLDHLAERLADQLDTRVKVNMGRRKGKLVIEFATVDDLERIVANIGITP